MVTVAKEIKSLACNAALKIFKSGARVFGDSKHLQQSMVTANTYSIQHTPTAYTLRRRHGRQRNPVRFKWHNSTAAFGHSRANQHLTSMPFQIKYNAPHLTKPFMAIKIQFRTNQ
ncbi:hypothetical protein LOK49_LG10G01601 [Camellia lanceoleosa]|uniref:Uncharacterized protein n=1 Tax=Camellia lanceoleosa TaxID=1840588 RepID=A0ACC0G5Z8_9ERIC|nr:hypothetical protein LOK49_LG10G01601 [Camellia lanceoleosa]